MSIPQVTQSQIDAMNRIAEEKYGVKNEPYEEPVQEEQEPVVEEQIEYEQEPEEQEDEIEEQAEELYPVKKEDNFKKLRIRASQAERERDEALEYIRKLQQQESRQQVQAPQEEDFDLAIEDEALVEGKMLKQMAHEIKNLKKAVRQYEQKSQTNSQQTIELRLRNQFPDFDKVVTHDNLVQLRELNPDLADTILKNEDQFKQAKLAYEMVKQLGIYRGEDFEIERKIANKNIAKPRTLTSIASTKPTSPLTKAHAFANGAPLTKEMKDSLYREMLEAMKGR